LEIRGGNADVVEEKGVEKIAIRKPLKTRALQIDHFVDAVRAVGAEC
jgi:hypothetical protein